MLDSVETILLNKVQEINPPSGSCGTVKPITGHIQALILEYKKAPESRTKFVKQEFSVVCKT